jgi:polar amino acid transport system permease protein
MLNKNNRLLYVFIITLFLIVICAAQASSQEAGLIIKVNYIFGNSIPNTSIYVDGSFAGTTDATGTLVIKDFPAGVHNITTAHDQYQSSTQRVDGSQAVEVTFTLSDKVITMPPEAMQLYTREDTDAKSMVTGASLYIDGVYAGDTDNYGKFWTTNYTGEHTVVAAKKGSLNATSTVNFVTGGSSTLYLPREVKKYSIFDAELFIYALSKEISLGLVATVKLSLIAFALGISIGLVMGLGRVSKNIIPRYCASIYVEGVRGLPLVLQILFVYYGLPFFLKDVMGVQIIINEFSAAIIALSINSSAYMAEIFKAGIEAINKGQTEASRSLGMNSWQSTRYVVLPQAFKIVLPALGNEFIALIKDSSISLVISYQELTYWAKSVGYEYYNAFTPLVAAGCLYLLITIPLGKLVQYMEKRYSVNSPRKEGAGWFGKRKKTIDVPEENI